MINLLKQKDGANAKAYKNVIGYDAVSHYMKVMWLEVSLKK